MKQLLIVHYDEIALKRGMRGFFERGLKHAVRAVVHEFGGVTSAFGRLLVTARGAETSLLDLAPRLALVPGVSSVLEACVGEGPNLDETLAAVEACLPLTPVASFAVRTKRADKRFPMNSEQISREVGAHVVRKTGWKVDLTNPELRILIEVVDGRAYVGTRVHRGFGGLPIGSSGRGIALLSGGIDSPVAAWMMMTRGLSLTFVHFHSAPYTSAASQDKVRELAASLARFHGRLRLILIPFADPIQKTIVETMDSRYRVVLYRRFMLRIAERAAADRRATCLVTGEALGQVASQTIENITTVQAAATLPILRPLVGMGKQQITDIAKRLGTFEISILPHEDCCTFFLPDRPATRTTPEELAAAEATLDIPALVNAAWDARTVETIG